MWFKPSYEELCLHVRTGHAYKLTNINLHHNDIQTYCMSIDPPPQTIKVIYGPVHSLRADGTPYSQRLRGGWGVGGGGNSLAPGF